MKLSLYLVLFAAISLLKASDPYTRQYCLDKDCRQHHKSLSTHQQYDPVSYERALKMIDDLQNRKHPPPATPHDLYRQHHHVHHAKPSHRPPSGQQQPRPAKPEAEDNVPTYEMFAEAAQIPTWHGWAPKPQKEIYDSYTFHVARNMTLLEQAMFLANILWETGGLTHTEEIACRQGGCSYGNYYGRGYIQLTWEVNYRMASQEIFADNRLASDPSLAVDRETAWRIALWYWIKYVRPLLQQNNALERFQFGYTIRAINGPLECAVKTAAYQRLQIYNQILRIWKIATNSPGTLAGCLNDQFRYYMCSLLNVFKHGFEDLDS